MLDRIIKIFAKDHAFADMQYSNIHPCRADIVSVVANDGEATTVVVIVEPGKMAELGDGMEQFAGNGDGIVSFESSSPATEVGILAEGRTEGD